MKPTAKAAPPAKPYDTPINPADPLADCDHVMGGYWGNHIAWLSGPAPALTDECQPGDMVDLPIYGHQPPENRIGNGQWITVEYRRYWLTFEAYDVQWATDPHDMFAAKCRCIRVCDRETGQVVWHRASAPVLTGEGLERQQRPPRISRAGYALLVALAIALFLSIAGLTVRAFEISAHQHRIERV